MHEMLIGQHQATADLVCHACSSRRGSTNRHTQRAARLGLDTLRLLGRGDVYSLYHWFEAVDFQPFLSRMEIYLSGIVLEPKAARHERGARPRRRDWLALEGALVDEAAAHFLKDDVGLGGRLRR